MLQSFVTTLGQLECPQMSSWSRARRSLSLLRSCCAFS
jgi:hypothetical protein